MPGADLARESRRGPGGGGRQLAAPALALGLALLLSLAVLAPVGALAPVASAQAFLLRSDPVAHALLRTPPPRVRLWFSEDLAPLTARAEVVDSANHQVDSGNSAVNARDTRELDLGLPQLRAGTYVVVWRVQSAADGDITGGTFSFQIALADGTAPAFPATLPNGHIAGGGNTGTSPALDGPAWLQTVATWLALLLLTFWVGGMLWETWILAPGGQDDTALADAGRLAAARFRRLAPWALGALLLANFVIVLALGAELAGSWQGAITPSLLGAMLFGSRFGIFWLARQMLVAIALGAALLELRGGAFARAWQPDTSAAWRAMAGQAPRMAGQWARWTLTAARALPGALARGWRRRSHWGRGTLLLAAALLVAFALAGHATAVPTPALPYALAVDLLHLVGDAAWAGGLFYIAVVLLPALRKLTARARAQVLARGLPAFNALALLSVLILALTGSLAATIQLTSWQQLLTTAYGQTLAIKVELFVVLAIISYYHAFRLRPRLERALAEEPVPEHIEGDGPGDGAASASTRKGGAGVQQSGGGDIGANALRLTTALEDWLQREAAVAAAILVCVALLAAFAGTLAPPAPAASGATHLPYISAPRVAGGLSVTLTVDPNTAVVTNTFTVTVRDASSGKPIDGADVQFSSQMLDMNMGITTDKFKATGTPGTYRLQSELTMGGRWQVVVGVRAPGAQTYQDFTFDFTSLY